MAKEKETLFAAERACGALREVTLLVRSDKFCWCEDGTDDFDNALHSFIRFLSPHPFSRLDASQCIRSNKIAHPEW